MTGIPNSVGQQYLLDKEGAPIGGTIYFYQSGTTTLATIYQDQALTIPIANPIYVAARQSIPTVYMDQNVTYRRYISYEDGTIWDIDPYNIVGTYNFLPLTGGTISGNLTVNGTLTTGGAFKVTSPGSGTAGGLVIKDAPGNPNTAYLQFTSNNGLSEYSWIRGRNDGFVELKKGLIANDQITTKASTASITPLVIPHGTTPSAPPDGAVWSDTTGFYGRVNGVTKALGGIAASGANYIKFTNGLTLQWGQVRSWTLSVTFPIPFTSAPYAVFHSIFDNVTTYNQKHLALSSTSATGFTLAAIDDDSAGGTIYGYDWLAIGPS